MEKAKKKVLNLMSKCLIQLKSLDPIMILNQNSSLHPGPSRLNMTGITGFCCNPGSQNEFFRPIKQSYKTGEELQFYAELLSLEIL